MTALDPEHTVVVSTKRGREREEGKMHLTDGEKFTSRDCAKFGAAANFTP